MPALREMSVVLAYLDWRTIKDQKSSFPQLRKATLDGDERTSATEEIIYMAGPADFTEAVQSQMMPRLRIVRARKQLGQWAWDLAAPHVRDMYTQWMEMGEDEEFEGEDVKVRIGRLDALLKEKAREDRTERQSNDTCDQAVSAKDLVSETEAGVIFFGRKHG